jgi:hypothetical protein
MPVIRLHKGGHLIAAKLLEEELNPKSKTVVFFF